MRTTADRLTREPIGQLAGRPVAKVVEQESGMRRRLLDVAARLFRRQGYHGTSMTDIAVALKITKGSLYHYFPGKTDILYEIYGSIVDGMNRRIDLHDPRLSPEERLRAVMHDVLETIATSPDQIAVYLQESPLLATQLPRRQFQELRRGEDRFTRYVMTTVEDGVARGDFRPVDTELAAFALIGMVSWASRWYESTRNRSIDEVVDTFFEISLGGLRATQPAKNARDGR